MKSGTFTLNPYAEAYVPFSKRVGPYKKNDGRNVGTESKGGTTEGSVVPTAQVPQSYNIHDSDSLYAAGDSKLKVQSGHGFHGGSSHIAAEITEKVTQHEDFEMDMAYLQMMFPGIAEESLFEVYLANKGDLDLAIDMLNHLELSVDSSQKLPDTLDIGDVPEAGNAPEVSDQKLKNVNVESGASSSGVSTTDPAV